ncbi:MAG TPA: hypothetical protein VK563_02680 [Puia sp.]|nr:hypothetical protein [Puia sp.]
MVKDLLFDLMDKKLSGEASDEELLELGEILSCLIPEKLIKKEEIECAYLRMIRRMRERGVLFSS